MAQAPILLQLPIEVNVECIAVDQGVQLEKGTPKLYAARECHRFTDKGNMCTQHSEELLGLRVKASNIPYGGDGLFASTRDFQKGDVICQYEGRRMTRAAFNNNPSAYAASIYDGSVIDARRTSDGFGRYANAAQRKKDVNAQIISEAKVSRGGSGKKLFLQATKRINDGDEILLAYGAQYHRQNPLPPGARAV